MSNNNIALQGIHKLYISSLIFLAMVIFLDIANVITQELYDLDVVQILIESTRLDASGNLFDAYEDLFIVATLLYVVFIALVFYGIDYLISGMEYLKTYDEKRYKIGSTGAKMQLIGWIFLIVLPLPFLILMILPHIIILFFAVGTIFTLIGGIMLLIAVWRVANEWRKQIIKIAILVGLLSPFFIIIDIVAELLLIASSILFVIGFKRIKDNIKLNKAIPNP